MPKTRSKHTRRTKAQWTEILGRFESSPLASRDFCRREGLPLSSFQRWRRMLGSAEAAEFVELVPTENEPASNWSLGVSLPNGVCLRFQG
jgi:transposase